MGIWEHLGNNRYMHDGDLTLGNFDLHFRIKVTAL